MYTKKLFERIITADTIDKPFNIVTMEKYINIPNKIAEISPEGKRGDKGGFSDIFFTDKYVIKQYIIPFTPPDYVTMIIRELHSLNRIQKFLNLKYLNIEYWSLTNRKIIFPKMNDVMGGLPTNISVDIIKQLIKQLMQLHTIGVYHRDIKVTNFITWLDGSKIQAGFIDFGSSIVDNDSIRDVESYSTFLSSNSLNLVEHDTWCLAYAVLCSYTSFRKVGKLRPRLNKIMDKKIHKMVKQALFKKASLSKMLKLLN